MKEEEWRDYLTLGLLGGAVSIEKAVRYSLSNLLGVKESYSANPGGSCLGQFVFALDCCRNCTIMGQCTCGCVLVPWGLCCNFQQYVSSACGCPACVCCDFGFGGPSAIYVALGTVMGCGATVWRRIL